MTPARAVAASQAAATPLAATPQVAQAAIVAQVAMVTQGAIAAHATTAAAPAAAPPRQVVHRTRGHTHGPITRLMSPSDLGERLKPFVFLDLFDNAGTSFGGFGMHPHSGIATCTLMIEGGGSYVDTTGRSGVIAPGGVEWLMAGGGAWHAGGPAQAQRVRGFQLWLALPPSHESREAESYTLAPDDLPTVGPARVLLGSHGGATSAIATPAPVNYLAVRLAAGERWDYLPPAGHTVAWLAVASGELRAPEPVHAGELAVFETGQAPLRLQAAIATEFVLGSALPHPHDLVLGTYSVHTSDAALRAGEARIREIGAALRAQGRLAT
jgi:redox-sensitive bicupin YhaK (pirin superfamily)